MNPSAPGNTLSHGPSLIGASEKFWAVNKPSGWLTIPGRSGGLPEKSDGVPVLSEWVNRELGKAWIVHRLDRGTSGVLVFARTAEAHAEANGWFERHEVKKQYRFLAGGEPGFPTFRASSPIGGKPSKTQFEVLRRFSGWSIFEGRARPQSGRRHQIRIHLDEAGFPIAGDREYCGPNEAVSESGKRLGLARLFLHAERLELPGESVFEAALPQDWFDVTARLEVP